MTVRAMGAAWLLAWATAWGTGCSSATTLPGTPDAGAADAGVQQAPDCGAWASEWCHQLAACNALELLTTWGDLATCSARAGYDCEYEARAPGSGLTRDAVQACATAIRAESCSDFRVGLPSACRQHGGLPVGASCGFDSQCMAGERCVGWASTTGCGSCQAESLSAEGGACTYSTDCGDGLICFDNGGYRSCLRPRRLGEACAPGQLPCRDEFTCDGTTCQPIGQVGQACSGGDRPCAPFDPIACDTTTTCKTLPVAARGQPCGSGLTPVVLCGGGSRCSQPQTGGIGICLGPEADGAPCSGSSCLAPAVCAPLTNTCVLPTEGTYCR